MPDIVSSGGIAHAQRIYAGGISGEQVGVYLVIAKFRRCDAVGTLDRAHQVADEFWYFVTPRSLPEANIRRSGHDRAIDYDVTDIEMGLYLVAQVAGKSAGTYRGGRRRDPKTQPDRLGHAI